MTGGLTASVGVGTSKFIAKVASDLDKPDGLVVVRARHRAGPAAPDGRHASSPASGRRPPSGCAGSASTPSPSWRRISEDELVRLLGKASGHWLFQLARADDDRPVVAERETKSVSVEGTYDTDLTDRKLMEGLLTRQAEATSPPGCASTGCPGAPSRSRCGCTTSPR